MTCLPDGHRIAQCDGEIAGKQFFHGQTRACGPLPASAKGLLFPFLNFRHGVDKFSGVFLGRKPPMMTFARPCAFPVDDPLFLLSIWIIPNIHLHSFLLQKGGGVRVNAHHPRRPRVACAASACAAPRGFAVLASALPRPAPCAVMDDSPSLSEPLCGLCPPAR